MKKYLIAIGIFLMALTCRAQNEVHKNYEYCILQTFGHGHSTSYKGAFIVYSNLMVERRMLMDDTHTGYLKLVMESINAIKSKGFVLVSSNMATTDSGMKGEYVFRREE